MNINDQADSATSIVRLSFQPAHKDKIETSEQWFDAMDKIKQEPNLGYVCKGESIEDELDIILFISWDYAAKPSANFLSGNIDYIFSPLSDLLAKKPRFIGNLCSITKRQTLTSFATRGGGFEFMIEIMTVRGPADATEAALRKIDKRLDSYTTYRSNALDFYDIWYNTLHGGRLYHLSTEKGNEDRCSEENIDQASFALFVTWTDREGRTEFQDPNIPDRTLPPVFQENFPSNFWQEEVIKPLEELGATISSWTYHKGWTTYGRKEGLIVSKFKTESLIVSKFKNWYTYGYMDSISLAEFEGRTLEQ
jgi:hypothetical protein